MPTKLPVNYDLCRQTSHFHVYHHVFMKAQVGAFNKENALVGAFSRRYRGTSRRFVDSSTPHTLLPTHHTFHTTWHKVHIHPAVPELLQAVAGDHGNNVEMLEQSASFWELCCALYISVHHAGLTLDTWEPIHPGSRNYF